ncbi:MAG: transporter [Aequorivita sp.]|nr:transporter [Aequorivita sp.]|tara:strand:- start:340 stop:1857 length:1518 start_codon:yes stop_codon:yes gene_type:complete
MKFPLFIITCLLFTLSNAQNTTDALRAGLDENTGTARFTALSGAMGALGGDFSATAKNPAGSAVFLNSGLTFSTSLFDVENNANYFGNSENSSTVSSAINQMGGVFVINNYKEDSAYKKFTIGFNYDITKNLDNELYIAGTGNTSIGEFFIAQAQGLPLSLLQLQNNESISDLYRYLGENEGTAAQNAFLGYQGYLFDAVDPNNPSNTSYISNIGDGSFKQQYAYLSEGYNSKFTLNMAAQVTNDWFFGINLNTHTIQFRQSSYLLENNNNAGSTITRVGFENNLSVNGAGVSAQIGAITKVVNNLRLGLSLDTPTWFQISEETTQYLESRRVFEGRTTTEYVVPNVVNVYEDYTLRTPAKVTASAAYIFGLDGLISFDYSYKDLGATRYSPSDDSYFRELNNTIKNTLKGVSKINLGGEYRLNELSLRGGIHYEESPYQNTEIMGELFGFSLGAGYNFGSFTGDIAYSRSEQQRNQQLYSIGLTNTAKIDSVYSNFILSLGFNF